ncbi:MAG: methionyl-tRNA formyltransferase [Phycisphaerae bacterium]
MNVALMGSVSSSFYCLDALIRGGVRITGVLGLDESHAQLVSDYRSLRSLAQQANLPFLSFVRVDEPVVAQFLKTHAPDLLWVIGLSQLVPNDLIGIARHGGVGFHPTLLPRGRGRAPVAWTILRGERAAVSLFYLTDEPDAGDIIVQREVEVLPDDYSEDLIQRTNEVLLDVVLELAPRIRSGNLPAAPQDHSKATYYPKRTPADGLIDWSQPTDAIYRLVRAAGRPYPGAFTFAGDRKLTVWRARPACCGEVDGGGSAAECGTILQVDTERGILTRTADGGLWLTETAVEGGGDLAVMLMSSLCALRFGRCKNNAG